MFVYEKVNLQLSFPHWTSLKGDSVNLQCTEHLLDRKTNLSRTTRSRAYFVMFQSYISIKKWNNGIAQSKIIIYRPLGWAP